MSQSDFSTIDPATKTGTVLASDLNDFRTAVNSNHSGSSAPSYIITGMTWINTSSNPWIIYTYDGDTNIPTGTIDTSTNTFHSIDSSTRYYPSSDVSGLVNNLAISTIPASTAYVSGTKIQFTPNIANTGATTLELSGLGTPKDIVKQDGTALAEGALLTSGIYTVVYDGTDFVLLGSEAVKPNSTTELSVGYTTTVANTTGNSYTIDYTTEGLETWTSITGAIDITKPAAGQYGIKNVIINVDATAVAVTLNTGVSHVLGYKSSLAANTSYLLTALTFSDTETVVNISEIV